MALLTIFGGIDSNDVVNPPDSGDAVGEVNSVSDANDVDKSCDGDNGDGDNSDGIVNNIGGNDSNDVLSPPDSGDCWVKRRYCLAGITKLGERVAGITKLE